MCAIMVHKLKGLSHYFISLWQEKRALRYQLNTTGICYKKYDR